MPRTRRTATTDNLPATSPLLFREPDGTEFKSGYEFFRSQLTGGNSQSSTGYVFDADWAEDAGGAPLLDSDGRLIPVFVPGETYFENWLPSRGAALNVDNQSVYLQDHWVMNTHWSADLGLRYEHVRSEATGGFIGVDTHGFVPRLAVAFDPGGNGRHVFHATYGHYSGRYNEAQIGANNNVGNPDLIIGSYIGPAGQGRSFAPGFDTANYETVLGQFPTANVFLEDGLTSPIVKEFTLSYGADLMNGRGYGEVSYIVRRTSHIIDDTITLANGVTYGRQERARRRHVHQRHLPEPGHRQAEVPGSPLPGPL